jgi:hypothetical protein
VPVTLLAILGIFRARALVDPLFWAAVTLVLAHGNCLNWTLHFNYQFLINYWCLATCCLAAGRLEMLSAVARALPGLVMLLAVVWKAIAPDYLDGTHFEFALLSDSRFAPVAAFLARADPEVLAENLARWFAFAGPAGAVDSIHLEGAASVRPLALALSWWGIAVELVLAVLFLLPASCRITRFADPILLVFVFTTYPIANLVGFGWILCVLGLAQCSPSTRRTSTAYLLAFVTVLLFKAPFSAYFRSLIGIALPFTN